MVNIETRGYFGSYDNLDYASDSPNMVLRQSAIIMNVPRIPGDSKEKYAVATFLRDSTLELIEQMEQGLYIEALVTDKFSSNEARQAERLVDPRVNQTKASEAFGIARTIFGLMPRTLVFKFGQYDVPYSLRGRLKPPETLNEHKANIASIRRGVRSYAIGANDRSFIDYATAFMKLGSLTEVKAPPTETETRQATEHIIRRMFEIPANEPKTIFEQ